MDSGSAVRGPPRHSNVRGPIYQRRPPPVYRDIPVGREGNSVNSRSHTHRSQFRDGHDYNEADSSRRNAGRRQEERAKGKNPLPMENQPISQNAGGQPKQPNVFDRLGASEQRHRDDNLRDVVNE